MLQILQNNAEAHKKQNNSLFYDESHDGWRK